MRGYPGQQQQQQQGAASPAPEAGPREEVGPSGSSGTSSTVYPLKEEQKYFPYKADPLWFGGNGKPEVSEQQAWGNGG